MASPDCYDRLKFIKYLDPVMYEEVKDDKDKLSEKIAAKVNKSVDIEMILAAIENTKKKILGNEVQAKNFINGIKNQATRNFPEHFDEAIKIQREEKVRRRNINEKIDYMTYEEALSNDDFFYKTSYENKLNQKLTVPVNDQGYTESIKFENGHLSGLVFNQEIQDNLLSMGGKIVNESPIVYVSIPYKLNPRNTVDEQAEVIKNIFGRNISLNEDFSNISR